MRPIIRVHSLSKRFRIGQRQPYRTLREALTNSVAAPFRYLSSRPPTTPAGDGAPEGVNINGAAPRSPADDGYVWALDDMSFEVAQGDVMGVIGRNGAGKSTLLKVLSRIIEPTAGRVELYGRVGSLLEVGTGFHPELSGRENVYLSGAILGMRRGEIQRKFDEIVAFAEVERFVDTPVKHFSSGMYVRLAFAVAAHLETEILLVDEVLAVGDINFQRKCLGKMGDVARQGRTVLFVSHNMASIESLCNSCLLLAGGRLEAHGEPDHLVAQYAAIGMKKDSGWCSLVNHPGRRRGSAALMTSIAVSAGAEKPTGVVRMGSPLSIRVSFRSPRPMRPVLGIAVRTSSGAPVFNVSDRYSSRLALCEPTDEATVVCDIEKHPLMPGRYVLDLWLGDLGADLDVITDAISFEVTPADLLGTGRLPSPVFGPVFCPATWSLKAGAAE